MIENVDWADARRYQELTGDKPIAESTGNPHDFTEDADAPKNRKAAKAR